MRYSNFQKRNKDSNIFRNFSFLFIFGIGMGFLEAIVVIYLREIYYPDGFQFPLNSVSLKMAIFECIREFCTLIILFAIAHLCGKNRIQRFSYFIYSFAIWDIFYYTGLKLLIGWPASFLTWDLLFLIPFPWVGPVLAPLVCSLMMIVLADNLLTLDQKQQRFKLRPYELWFILGGFILIMISFLWDFSGMFFRHDFIKDIYTSGAFYRFRALAIQYNPTTFKWGLFSIGITLELFTILALLLRRTTRKRRR